MNHLDYFNLPSPPPFAGETIKNWQDLNFLDLEDFVIEEQRHGCASVNVFRVVGTRHPDYAGGTWLDLLNNGKRMSANLPLFRDNPGYYQQTGPKAPYMHYASIDGGDIYIGDEGNHRTCIARFHFFTQGMTTLHGITLQDYRIDWVFKEAVNSLQVTAQSKGIPLTVTVLKKLVQREDAADWRLDRYSLTARVFNVKKGEMVLLDRESLERYAERLRRPWWKF